MSTRAFALALSWLAVAALVSACCALMVLARRLPMQKRLAYLLFPVSQLAMALFALWGEESYGLPEVAVWATGSVALASAAYDVWLFRRVAVAERDKDAARTAQLLAEQLDAQARHAELLSADASRAQEMREGIRETLSGVGDALDKGDRTAASKLLASAAQTLRRPDGHFCAHPVVDALLAAKTARCRDAGVALHAQADVPADIAISDVDLCAVFANLLDNAVNAAGRLAQEEAASDSRHGAAPFVELDAHITAGCLVVRVVNSYDAQAEGAPASKPSRTRKPARSSRHLSEHGWGTSIVEGVTARHDGSVKTSGEGGVYEVEVVLPFA